MEAADHIRIDASFKGVVKDLLDVSNTKPIADAVNYFADEWDGAGEVIGELALKVPLDGSGSPIAVRTKGTIEEATCTCEISTSRSPVSPVTFSIPRIPV